MQTWLLLSPFVLYGAVFLHLAWRYFRRDKNLDQ